MKSSFLGRMFKISEEEEIKREGSEERVTTEVRDERFVLDPKYKITKKLGQGAYGMVVSAMNAETGERIAIKKNTSVFQSKTCAKRILREMKLLRHFDHPNIVKLLDVVNPLTMEDFDDVYLVLEFMKADLHRVVYSDNKLTDSHISYMMYQILCGLKYMHSAGVYHRDLKCANVLVDKDCNVKICDFGLARGVPEEEDPLMTEYVVTRWYRPPEVVLDAQRYGPKLDVWSAGCIMAELYKRKPIFRGEDYTDQLREIFKVIGSPSQEDVAACVHDDVAIRFLHNLGHYEAKSWESVLPRASEVALDLISRMLTFNPEKRISVDEALRHPFFAKYYNEEFVNVRSVSDTKFDTTFESLTRDKDQIQAMMMEEIQHYRPSARFPLEPVRRPERRRNFGELFRRPHKKSHSLSV